MSVQERDEVLLAEKVGQLTEENTSLKIRASTAESELRHYKTLYAFTGHLSKAAWVFFYILVLSVPVFAIHKSWTSPNSVTHCQVTECSRYENGKTVDCGWNLKGLVSWHANLDLGSFKTIDEAREAAKKLGCPDVNR